jgi:hypothetical protein
MFRDSIVWASCAILALITSGHTPASSSHYFLE